MQSGFHQAMETAASVYHWMQDEESKMVFRNKMLYLMTGENRFLHYIMEYYDPERYQTLRRVCASGREIIIYGAGAYCASVVDACIEYGNSKIRCICDGDAEKWGKTAAHQLPIISPEELKKEHTDAMIIIGTMKGCKEIEGALNQCFPKEQVFPFAVDILEQKKDEQYFDPEIIHFQPQGEIFVDGGSYDFETSEILMSKTGVNRIYAFEPDPINAARVRERIAAYKETEIMFHEKGLWDKEETVAFDASGKDAARIMDIAAEDRDSRIRTAALDDVTEQDATFIKLDIEGAELKALQGARKTIQKNRPKLAICVYHKPEDMLELTEYVRALVPEYRFYLRHYSNFHFDTILYAVA